MALDDFAEADVDEVAVVVDDRIERVDVAQHPHDLELLLVQRVAGEVALDCERVLHEARAVERANRVGVRDSRCDDLPATGVAGHEMRLDQSGRDAQVRLDKSAVQLHRRAPPGGDAQIDVRGLVAREMILDAHGLEHPWVADDCGELLALVRPMQAGRDQDDDLLARHARREHALDQRPQEQMVGDRPRDVADQDAGALAAAHQRVVGRRADRLRQRVAHGTLRIGQLGHRALADDGRARMRRQPDLQSGLTVAEMDRFFHVVPAHRLTAGRSTPFAPIALPGSYLTLPVMARPHASALGVAAPGLHAAQYRDVGARRATPNAAARLSC